MEDRFVFELDLAPPSLLDSLWSFLKLPFATGGKNRPAAAAGALPRQRLARKSG